MTQICSTNSITHYAFEGFKSWNCLSKMVAYLRVSTDKQDLNNQNLEILEFARKKDLKVDDFVEVMISSRKTSKQRRIDDLLERLIASDTLIVTEMSQPSPTALPS